MSAVRFRPPAPFRDLEELEVAASRIYGVPVAALDHLIEIRRTPEEPTRVASSIPCSPCVG